MILGGLLGEPPASLRFRAAVRGKPELDRDSSGANPAGKQPTLCFNLSHSSELALIAVCRDHELGVDLERVRTIHEADRIVASFFSPAEHAEFATISDDLKPLAFFRGWTRKEAILKGLGIGLAGLAARYETRFGTGDLAASFRTGNTGCFGGRMAALGSQSPRRFCGHGGHSRPHHPRSISRRFGHPRDRRCQLGRRLRTLNKRVKKAHRGGIAPCLAPLPRVRRFRRQFCSGRRGSRRERRDMSRCRC